MGNILKCDYINNIKLDFTLNITNLVNVYTPLIGNGALSLYLVLANEKNFLNIDKNNKKNLYDLCNLLSCSLEEFHNNRRILEAFNLLNSFISTNQIGNDQLYLFELKEPLVFNEFIKNNKFKKSFINKVGIERYQELEFYYKNSHESSFIDLVDTYDDVFEKFNTDKEYLFDFDLFILRINSLSKSNVIFTKEVKDIIEFYFTNYCLSFNQIEVAIMNSIKVKGENFEVELEVLESELSNQLSWNNNYLDSNIVELKRTSDFFTNKDIDANLKKDILLQYRNLKPEDFLASLQKHKLSPIDKELINTLRRDYHLSNPLINIIIDYSIFKTHGKLNINYIRKVAITLNMLFIDNIKKAYEYFLGLSERKSYKNSNQSLDIDDLEYVDLFN